MPIQELGPSVSHNLRSQVVIDSAQTALRELIRNSLDAGATSLRIKLDPASLSMCVEDNGRGILPSDLPFVGKRNYSSFYNSPLHRGEALFSIGVCCAQVVIRTKTKGHSECFAGLAGQESQPHLTSVLVDFFQTEKIASLGTQVMVSHVFGKLPVRRRTDEFSKTADAMKHGIKMLLFEMLHDNLGVALEVFLLVNGAFKKILSVAACASGPDLFGRLFRFPVADLTRIEDECSSCRLKGYFSLEGSQKLSLQFVFINGRKVGGQKGINAIFSAVGYRRSHRGVLGQALRLFPLYCFDITYPQENQRKAILFLKKSLLKHFKLNERQRQTSSQIQRVCLGTESHRSEVDVHMSQVTMQDVANLEVIGQLQNQFILAKLEGLLYVLDQHACDERIRVEELLAEYSRAIADETSSNMIRCPSPIKILLAPDEREDLLPFQSLLEIFGIRMCITEFCTVTHLPRVLVHIREPELLKVTIFQHVNDVRDGQKQPTVTGRWIQDVNNIPRAIYKALVSIACRSSIKFGTILSKAEMEYLVRKLYECTLPFQCAHGRTTIAPLAGSVVGFLLDEEL